VLYIKCAGCGTIESYTEVESDALEFQQRSQDKTQDIREEG